MTEVNVPSCPVHGAFPRSLHSENFEGIVTVIEELLDTVSGVGTVSYARCPYGYPYNFEGIVRALEDLNTSISGLSGGGGGSTVAAGSGIFFTSSGTYTVINATVVSASGISISAGSGIYLSDAGTRINLNADAVGTVSISYSGSIAVFSGTSSQGGGSGVGTTVVVSGSPGANYNNGSLWFDTNEGRLFIYASGADIEYPAWYQTNAEGIAIVSEVAPSGYGENAPPRTGSIWFNTLLGSLFVYDAVSSGWYETAPSRSVAYGLAPSSINPPGAGWFDSSSSVLTVWDGDNWVSISGN